MNKEPAIIALSHHDPTIHLYLRGRISADDCITTLALQNRDLRKRVLELERIAPKKIKMGDTCWIWRAPDALVPVTELH